MALRDGDGVSAALAQVTGSLGRLVADHLELARLELWEEIVPLAGGAALTVVGGALLLFGWLLLMGCFTALLAQALPLSLAFLVVAGANVLAGGAGTLLGFATLRRAHIGLKASRQELDRDRRMVRSVSHELARASREAGRPEARQ